MHCSIYKGRRAQNTYLYVPVRDEFSTVPAAILQAMGPLDHVIDLVLTPQQKLARLDSVTVMRHLLIDGCYVQMPPADEKLDPRKP